MGQLQHPIAERGEASDNVTADVEPSDQYRTDQAERDGRSQPDPAKLLDRLCACGCRQNALLRSRDKHVHGMAQLSRKCRVLDRKAAAFLNGPQFGLTYRNDTGRADRIGPQFADGHDQLKR